METATPDKTDEVLQHMTRVQIAATLRSSIREGLEVRWLGDLADRMNRKHRRNMTATLAYALGESIGREAICVAMPGGLSDMVSKSGWGGHEVALMLARMDEQRKLELSRMVHRQAVMMRARQLYERHDSSMDGPSWPRLDNEAKAPFVGEALEQLRDIAPPTIN